MRWVFYFILKLQMISMKYFSLICCLSLLFSITGFCQQRQQNKFSIQFNIQHQDLPINLDVGELQTIHTVSFRPYLSADFQYNLKNRGNQSRFITAHLGYYYNQYNSRWLATNVGYGGRLALGDRLSVAPSLELGIGFARDQTVNYRFESDKWIGQSEAADMTYEVIVKPRLDIAYAVNQSIGVVVTMHGLLFSDEDLFAIPYYGIGLGLRYAL